MVTQHLVIGKKYTIESSTDAIGWSPVEQPFTAQDEVLTNEFDADLTGRFFRIREVP
jgi:hypothetical protein